MAWIILFLLRYQCCKAKWTRDNIFFMYIPNLSFGKRSIHVTASVVDSIVFSIQIDYGNFLALISTCFIDLEGSSHALAIVSQLSIGFAMSHLLTIGFKNSLFLSFVNAMCVCVCFLFIFSKSPPTYLVDWLYLYEGSLPFLPRLFSDPFKLFMKDIVELLELLSSFNEIHNSLNDNRLCCLQKNCTRQPPRRSFCSSQGFCISLCRNL